MSNPWKPWITAAIIAVASVFGFSARAALRDYSAHPQAYGANAVFLAMPDFSRVAAYDPTLPEPSALPMVTTGLPPLLTTAQATTSATAPPETPAPETSSETTAQTSGSTTIHTAKHPAATTTAATEPEPLPAEPYEELTFVYGQSEAGRDLFCHRLRSETGEHKYAILLVFEIHGFEDAFDRDGQLLCDIAQYLLSYYRENIGALRGCELYIVPSANPDGLLDGVSCYGFGRCQKSGYDINREFDTGNWSPNYSSRNKTGDTPLTSCESIALYNLVMSVNPDIVVDFHGWLDMYIGDRALYECFSAYQPMRYQSPFSSRSGYFSAWAATVADRALLYEFPWPTGYSKPYYVSTNGLKVAKGLNRICDNIGSLAGA